LFSKLRTTKKPTNDLGHIVALHDHRCYKKAKATKTYDGLSSFPIKKSFNYLNFAIETFLKKTDPKSFNSIVFD